MLVLSRLVDQAVLINDGEIKVVVVEVKGDQVRLGFEAPRSISIRRAELSAEITAANQAAVVSEETVSVSDLPTPPVQ